MIIKKFIYINSYYEYLIINLNLNSNYAIYIDDYR